jgi:hypothetical protein
MGVYRHECYYATIRLPHSAHSHSASRYIIIHHPDPFATNPSMARTIAKRRNRYSNPTLKGFAFPLTLSDGRKIRFPIPGQQERDHSLISHVRPRYPENFSHLTERKDAKWRDWDVETMLKQRGSKTNAPLVFRTLSDFALHASESAKATKTTEPSDGKGISVSWARAADAARN